MAIIRGTNGRNRLRGTTSKDTLLGLGGNDILDGRKGADKMKGGSGDDTYTIDHAGDKVIENAGQGTDTVKSKVTFALGANVEILYLLGTGAINGTGNELVNLIVGNGVANTLMGGDAADVLMGGEGGDSYLYEGDDNLAAPDVILDTGTSGTDVIVVGTTVSHLYMGGSTITGIEGLTFLGGDFQGASFVQSQFGAGLISTAFSVVGVDGFGQRVEILQASDFNAAGWQFTNWQSAADSLSIFGVDNSDDTITGSSGVDEVQSYGGADTIRGGGGADLLFGGEGGDTYVFGVGDIAAGETIADTGGTGTDTILVAEGLATFEHVDFRAATITGIERVQFGVDSLFADFDASQLQAATTIVDNGIGVAIWIHEASNFDGSAWVLEGPGGSGWIDNNGIWINGTNAADSITGTSESDQLLGHAGIDELAGGGGRDQFRFAPGDSDFGTGFRDRVMDFTQGEDWINLTAFANPTFIGTATFSGNGSVEVRYTDDGTNTIIQINTDANKLVDMEIELANVVLTLTVDDFFFGAGA